MQRLWCRECRKLTNWLPNFEIMYRWEGLYVIQYMCEKGCKRDITFDGYSFDKRLESYGVCIFEDDLECRKEVG